MKMKRIAATTFLAIAILPTSLSISAFADDAPANPEKGERPHVEANHESVEGIQFVVLGGAVIVAIGLAYKVGQTRAKKKEKEGNQ